MSVPPELLDRIKAIVVERLFLEIEPSALAADRSLTEAYGVDSVRLFDMVVGLEEDFGIAFDDSELSLANFDTVDDIALRVHAKSGGV